MPPIRRPLVISGPSGTGKSTLLKRLFEEYPNDFGFSVSHTTRSPRPGEVDGIAYHFTNMETFENMIGNNEFLEHAQFSGNRYGTTFKAIEDVSKLGGKRAILDIDAQGVRLVKASHLKADYLFIAPPSIEDLRKRLTGRGTESEQSIQKRMATAIEELKYAQTGAHDFVIINDDLETAYRKLKTIACAESEGLNFASDELPGYGLEDSNNSTKASNGTSASKPDDAEAGGPLFNFWTWLKSWL